MALRKIWKYYKILSDVEYKELISRDPSTIVDYATHQMAPELLQLHDLHHSTSLPTVSIPVVKDCPNRVGLRGDEFLLK